MRCALLCLSALAIAVFADADAGAAGLEAVGSFTNPTYVTSEPNDSDHLLVVEKAGRIMLSDGGVVTPYLDLSSQVQSTGAEQGLFSVAPAPDYATSGLLYVYYTRLGGDLQIDEFRASGGSVAPATRRPVLTIEHSMFPNHNGGQLQFGPDGYLYIGTGDGGGAGDSLGNGQNTATVLGKLLRIDPRATATAPYSIPASNPFVGAPGADEVWSLGLRNPWRFSFDRATGDLVIGDVGQNTWEEVDYLPGPAAGRGRNFGWNRCEGFHPYPPASPAAPCSAGGVTAPVLEYGHSAGACSITGGYVVRDATLGDLYGRYLFADACSARVSSVRLGLPTATGLRTEPFSAPGPSSFGEDACGRVYLASLTADAVYRIAGDAPPVCPPPAPGPGEAPAIPTRCGGEPVTRAVVGGAKLEGTRADDVIAGGAGRDRISGRGGDDIICGRGGDDRIKGGAGRDRLRGGGGDDDLRGGGGHDRCRGGAGKDRTRSC